jgi:hypothetical protein
VDIFHFGWHGDLIARTNTSMAERSVREISGSAVIPSSSSPLPRIGSEKNTSAMTVAEIVLSVSARDAWARVARGAVAARRLPEMARIRVGKIHSPPSAPLDSSIFQSIGLKLNKLVLSSAGFVSALGKQETEQAPEQRA